MTAFLPQQESFISGMWRKCRLTWDRRLYQYDDTHVSPLALLKDLPILDDFSFKWLEAMGKKLLDVTANRVELERGTVAKERPAAVDVRSTGRFRSRCIPSLSVSRRLAALLGCDPRMGRRRRATLLSDRRRPHETLAPQGVLQSINV